jgi:CheY-like chemotaxis protein
MMGSTTERPRRRHQSGERGRSESPPRHGPRVADTVPVPVLLVDDSPQFVRVARRVLERATPRFAIHIAGTGEEALAFLRREPPFADAPRPEFVLLDFNLPDLDAPAVLHRVMEDSDLRSIPFLVLTQTPWPGDDAAARAAGASGYRAKPSRVGALRDIVSEFWRAHRHAGDDPPR